LDFVPYGLGPPYCKKNHCKTYGALVCGIRCICVCYLIQNSQNSPKSSQLTEKPDCHSQFCGCRKLAEITRKLTSWWICLDWRYLLVLLAWIKIVTVLILAGLDYNTLVNSCEDLQNPQFSQEHTQKSLPHTEKPDSTTQILLIPAADTHYMLAGTQVLEEGMWW